MGADGVALMRASAGSVPPSLADGVGGTASKVVRHVSRFLDHCPDHRVGLQKRRKRKQLNPNATQKNRLADFIQEQLPPF